MADPSYERTDRADFRVGTTGQTGRHEPDAVRGNPDLGPDGIDPRDRSIGSLVKELRDESTTLIRQEIALAKTEMSEKASKAGRNIASIGVGAAVLYAGVLVLLFGLTIVLYFFLKNVVKLEDTWAGILAFLLVGGITALIGYGLIQKGLSALKRESLVPEKTVQSLKEDKQWLSNQTK